MKTDSVRARDLFVRRNSLRERTRGSEVSRRRTILPDDKDESFFFFFFFFFLSPVEARNEELINLLRKIPGDFVRPCWRNFDTCYR